MWETMYAGKGIGLAANQVNELQRVIVLHMRNFRLEIVNPVVKRKFGGRVSSPEECLSFPGKRIQKGRSKFVEVHGFTRDWEPISRTLNGLVSICMQHEIDHLNGITLL